MVSVYVIESVSAVTWYTGMAIDPIKRLKEHNNGKNRFTKGHRPWKIIFTESHPDREAAKKRNIFKIRCREKMAKELFQHAIQWW